MMALANELYFEIPLNSHTDQPRAVVHASGVAGADGMTAMMPDRECRMSTLMGSAERADMPRWAQRGAAPIPSHQNWAWSATLNASTSLAPVTSVFEYTPLTWAL